MKKFLCALIVVFLFSGCATTTIIKEVPSKYYISETLTEPCPIPKANITTKSMQGEVGRHVANLTKIIEMCNKKLQGIRDDVNAHNTRVDELQKEANK